MPKFSNGSVLLADIPPSHRAKKRTAGMMTLALAVCMFALSPICRAQTNPSGNETMQSGQGSVQNSVPQGDTATNPAANPPEPGVRVVRLSLVEGTVQILHGGAVEFPHAVMNMPLRQGSQIKTAADGRAEIEFEDGSVARITPNSSLQIDELGIASDGALMTGVEQLSGLVYYEVHGDPKTPFKVRFGDRTATPAVNSTFRVDLNATPQALAVIDGKVQVQGTSNSNLAEVPQGKTIQFQATGSSKYTIENWIMPNGFDDWNDQLDQEAAQQAQNQTPARVQQGGGSMMDSGVGWSDLDNSGGWYPLPGYGMVWQPYGAGPGFDPYGYGTWANYGGFGYSWISGYSWGWLPFNCGSWSYIGSFGWGWMPGAYGCGGYGFGYIGYGRRGRHWRANVYRGPAGYRAPVAPATGKGQSVQRIVRVGSPQPGMRTSGLHATHGNAGHGNAARTIDFHGTKIAPLHSMAAGVRVPMRNAALYNNSFAHPSQGISRGGPVNVARAEPLASHAFGGTNQGAFGQHTSFGPHGSFSGAHSALASGGYRGGSGFRGGGMGNTGGFTGGGFHGGGGGGFHGGGGGGGGGHAGH